jgi:hypothetical protein
MSYSILELENLAKQKYFKKIPENVYSFKNNINFATLFSITH